MTIKQQAETFLRQIEQRRRRPAKQATLRAYRSHIDTWVVPLLGGVELSQMDNRQAKQFVEKLAQASLSAGTIGVIFNVFKQIVASAVDSDGNRMFERTWNADFLDLPVVKSGSQAQPVIGQQALQEAISHTIGQEKALYALLAGTGLRIGEARSLKIGQDDGRGSFWLPERGLLIIRTTVVRAGIQMSCKSDAGQREIDLPQELNDFLKKHLTIEPGLMFKSETGGLTDEKTLYRRLKAQDVPGFHSFRRFRVSHLAEQGVPRPVVRLLIGHAAGDVTERYEKVSSGQRRDWVEKAGLGFRLEAM